VQFGQSVTGDLPQATRREWLLTNGIGGYAASTIAGMNTRRYHGLLIAAVNPPGDRRLLVAKVEEELEYDGYTWPLGTNQFGNTIHPGGFKYIYSFSPWPVPTIYYQLRGVFLRKRLFMIHGQNTTVINYHLVSASGPVALRLMPLVNARDHHHLVRKRDWQFDQRPWATGVIIQAYPGAPDLMLLSDRLEYKSTGTWWHNFTYTCEQFRGLDYTEDHYNPGIFSTWLHPGDRVSLILTTSAGVDELPFVEGKTPGSAFIEQLYQDHLQQKQNIRSAVSSDRLFSPHDLAFIEKLLVAADQFIIRRRSSGKASILAGYPWFTDWGRDTMISLPGLTLVSERYELARQILETFTARQHQGLIPNYFSDSGDASYNTADASLWFIYAVYKYLDYSGDLDTIKGLFPLLEEIISAYRQGTLFNIHAADDDLITAGSENTQLTWMDAKIGDWAVTPRHGKAVEINALWYNALMSMDSIEKNLSPAPRGYYRTLAGRVATSFNKAFWNPHGSYLYDVIGPGDHYRDDAIRPNQILAVSLPFSPLSRFRQKAVVNVVSKHLLTPYGLRSLSPASRNYRGRYGGDQYERDSAYHQGTVWAWLMGPFLTSLVRVHNNSQKSKQLARRLLDPLFAHINEYGLNTVSEIFTGDPPYQARGCFAQAWSVAEILRSYFEDIAGPGSHSSSPVL